MSDPSPTLTDERRTELAETIGQHAPTVDTFGDPRAAGCSKGCAVEVSPARPFRHHLADTLAPLIARMVADAEQRGFDRGVNATFETDGALLRAAQRALREFAAWWDDPSNIDELQGLAERHYRVGGPSMPAIVARLRADRIGGDA